MISFDEYQSFTPNTATYPCGRMIGLYYTAMGLAGETGEVLGKVSKIIRDDDIVITNRRKKEISNELGDCLWFISQICNELGLNMSDVVTDNMEKLKSRKTRGVISGSGDNR